MTKAIKGMPRVNVLKTLTSLKLPFGITLHRAKENMQVINLGNECAINLGNSSPEDIVEAEHLARFKRG